MRSPLAAILTFLCLLLTPNAQALGGDGGGGDRCEDRFKVIALDFQKWISAGGPKRFNFGVLSIPLTAKDYSDRMSDQLSSFQITCKVGPVLVNGKAKECRSYVDTEGKRRIECDLARFYSGLRHPENDPTQYNMVHHEFATLADLEVPDDADSKYPLTDQITGFLENQIVMKLAVNAPLGSRNSGLIISIPFNGFTRFSQSHLITYATLTAFTGERDEDGRRKYAEINCQNYWPFYHDVLVVRERSGSFPNGRVLLQEMRVQKDKCTDETLHALEAEINTKRSGWLIITPNDLQIQ